MAKIGEFEKEFQQRLEQEARKRGIDPARLKDTTVSAKWGDVEVTLPAPSPQTIDSWLDKYGGVIVGAFVALVGVALGAVVRAASGGRSSDHQT